MAECVPRAASGRGRVRGRSFASGRLLVALPVVAALTLGCSSSGSDPFPDNANCDITGTWAIFVEVGVGWKSAVISPGAGTVRQWILSRIVVGPTGQLASVAHACGIGAQNVPLGSPWFATVLNEWTGVQFLPGLFDSGTLADVPIPVSVSSSNVRHPTIGDDFRTEPSPFGFGLNGLDGAAPWPTTDQIAPFIVDADQDGFPGITGLPFHGQVPGEAEGVEFQDPRLTITVDPPPRAAKLFLALRTRAGLEGKLASCSPTPRLEGDVVPATLLVETRNVACLVDGTGTPCDAAQIAFIDQNLPAFNANGASKFIGVKVRDTISCAEVRSMDYR